MSISIVSKSSAHSVTTADPKVSFDTVVENDSPFFSLANPTRLTIPSGVTEVEIFVFANADGTGPTSSDASATVYKNGSNIHKQNIDNLGTRPFGFSTGILSVTPGDYFELSFDTYSTSYNYNAGQVKFMAATPERAGFVRAMLAADTNLGSSYSALTWATPELDTAITHDGTTGFVAPAGANYAVVSVGFMTTNYDSSPGFKLQLKVDGSTVRQYENEVGLWNPGPPCFGIIEITEGETLTLEALDTHSSPLNATYSHISIEWIR